MITELTEWGLPSSLSWSDGAFQLSLSRKLFQRVFDDTTVAMSVTSVSGCYTQVNQAMCEMLGYEDGELIGLHYRQITHPDDVAENEFQRIRMLHGRCDSFQLEKRYIRKDGGVVWTQSAITVIRDEFDRVQFTIEQLFNIDRQKQLDQEVIRQNEQIRVRDAHHQATLEAERKCIARDIHDELGQQLLALKIGVGTLRLTFEHDPQVVAHANQLRDLIDMTIGTVRRVSTNLRPATLDAGLVAALQCLAEDFSTRTGLDCTLHTEGMSPDRDICDIHESHSLVLFRATQESLTNVARHADASRVRIHLQHHDHALSLAIEDNGCGFVPDIDQYKKNHYGLLGMRERVHSVGGLLKIDSSPRRGTRIQISLPVRHLD